MLKVSRIEFLSFGDLNLLSIHRVSTLCFASSPVTPSAIREGSGFSERISGMGSIWLIVVGGLASCSHLTLAAVDSGIVHGPHWLPFPLSLPENSFTCGQNGVQLFPCILLYFPGKARELAVVEPVRNNRTQEGSESSFLQCLPVMQPVDGENTWD